MPKIFLTKKEVREMGELARDRLDKLKFVGSSAKARVTIDAVIERGTWVKSSANWRNAGMLKS